LVRGELTEEHLIPLVEDIRDGENHISGDYSAATNFINREAVLAIVEVLCESDHLTPEEKRVLWESFANLEHESCHGTTVFRRGQMMGSYVSFPMLCIINRCMYNITRTWEARIKKERIGARPARFNGDDCAFNGTNTFFQQWEIVTGYYGMVVNREKTGQSRERIELNSKVYFVSAKRFAPKPVLSFLDCQSETLLLEAWNQSLGLSIGVRKHILNHILLPWIKDTDVTPNSLPKGLFRCLVKKAWFRKAMHNSRSTRERTYEWDQELKEFCKTTKRGIELVRGPRLAEESYDWFNESYSDIQREYLERWRGAKIRIPNKDPHVKAFPKADKGKMSCQLVTPHYSVTKHVWGWMWPKTLLNEVRVREPWRLCNEDDNPKWVTDHHFLTAQRKVVTSVRAKFFGPILEGEWARVGGHYCLIGSAGYQCGVSR